MSNERNERNEESPLWAGGSPTYFVLSSHNPATPRYLALAREAVARSAVAPATAFRAALRALYALNGDDGATPAQVAAALDDHARRLDDLGPAQAVSASRATAREWYKETKRCPWCGTAGVFHEGRP